MDAAPVAPGVSDRRRTRRFPAWLPGKLSCERRGSAEGHLVDISTTGALFRVANFDCQPGDPLTITATAGGKLYRIPAIAVGARRAWWGFLAHLEFPPLAPADARAVNELVALVKATFEEHQEHLTTRANDGMQQAVGGERTSVA